MALGGSAAGYRNRSPCRPCDGMATQVRNGCRGGFEICPSRKFPALSIIFSVYYQCIREHQNSPISYLAKRSTLLQHRVPFAFSMAFVVPWCHLSGTGAFSIRTSTRFSTEPYRLRSCRPPSRGRTAPCRFIHGQAEVREPDCRVSRSRRGVRPSGDTPGGADCEPGTAGSSRSYPVRSAHAGAFHE